MREACCTVSISGESGRGHFPDGLTWYIHWSPKGYSVSADEFLVCAFPDYGGLWCRAGYSLRGPLPPIIAAAVESIERQYRENPPIELQNIATEKFYAANRANPPSP